MLTLNEFLILRQLEIAPDSSAYNIFKALGDTPFPVPIGSVYRGINSLWALCAIEKGETRTHVNGVPIQPYELSDAGRSSLAELRKFFGEVR